MLGRLELAVLGTEFVTYLLCGVWLVAMIGLPPLAVAACIAVVPGALRALYLLRAFLVAGVSRRGRPIRAMLRLFVAEWRALALTHSVRQPLRGWLTPPVCGSAEAGSEPLIVFVHGYCCNSAFWRPMQRLLLAHGWHAQVALDIEPVFGDIDQLAEHFLNQLRTRNQLPDGRDCLVIAHSMGGLVARAALKRSDAPRVSGLITLGTPHAGSRLARGAPGVNARQMEPDSEWLRRLNASTGEYAPPLLAIASQDDELVAPWQSGLAAPACSTHTIEGVGHLAMVADTEVADLVNAALRGMMANAVPPSDTQTAS